MTLCSPRYLRKPVWTAETMGDGWVALYKDGQIMCLTPLSLWDDPQPLAMMIRQYSS